MDVPGLKTLNTRIRILESQNTSQSMPEHKHNGRTFRILNIKKGYIKSSIDSLNEKYEASIAGSSDIAKIAFTMEFVYKYGNDYAANLEVDNIGSFRRQLTVGLVEDFLTHTPPDEIGAVCDIIIAASKHKLKLTKSKRTTESVEVPNIQNIPHPITIQNTERIAQLSMEKIEPLPKRGFMRRKSMRKV